MHQRLIQCKVSGPFAPSQARLPQHRACCRPVEKERLDEWYIRNASLWLDVRIAVMTALMFFRGDRRTPHLEQTAWTSILQINEPQPRRVAAHRPFVPNRMAASKEPAVAAAAILGLRSAPGFGRRDGV